MSLEDDLKARTLALISNQMATWVVDIQHHIRGNQEQLVRMLDELQEQVVRYDEKIDERAIGQALAEVVAQQPPPAPTGPGFDKLKSSLAVIEKGASLSEVLTYLVNEVAQYVDRVGMFIVKGPSAIGWYGKGFDTADAVKQINVPLTADTIFKTVNGTRQAARFALQSSPGTAQTVARLGGQPQGVLAVPLILRDKLAAILYCDSRKPEVPHIEADLIEVLVDVAGRIIDVISVAPKPAVGKTTASGTTSDRAVQVPPGARPPAPAHHEEAAGTVMVRPGTNPPTGVAPRPPAPPPAPPPPAPHDEGSSTVMFNAAQLQSMRQTAPAAPPRPAAPPPPPPPPPAAAIPPEEQKAHDDAKRFARLVVSEIKLYNEAKVNEGRRHKDLYERLKEDIERGRQMYTERVSAHVRETTNYFYDELVRILAGGDSAALGPM